MANRLTMAKIQAILSLHEQDWRNREIARELDVDRETVAKYVLAAGCDPKPAKAPIGSAGTPERATEPRESPLVAEPSGDERPIETSRASKEGKRSRKDSAEAPSAE
jgi:transposase